MTGRELMDWLAEQPSEVLDREVRVPDDDVRRHHPLVALKALDGFIYLLAGQHAPGMEQRGGDA